MTKMDNVFTPETYKLNLRKECENCPEFDVEVKEGKIYTQSIEYMMVRTQIDRTISCKHLERCANMMNVLKEKIDERREEEQADISKEKINEEYIR